MQAELFQPSALERFLDERVKVFLAEIAEIARRARRATDEDCAARLARLNRSIAQRRRFFRIRQLLGEQR